VPSQPPRSSTVATEVAAILSRLALHYWRPDFTPAQAKLMLQDFLHDLDGYTPKDVNYACEVYRQNAENRFYPTPGQLLAILRRYESPSPRLPRFQAPRQIGMTQSTKTVAQVLREHGYEAAAQSWGDR
jgi:hypothetical protein